MKRNPDFEKLIRQIEKAEAELVARGWTLAIVRELIAERRPAVSPYAGDPEETGHVVKLYREILPPQLPASKSEAA